MYNAETPLYTPFNKMDALTFSLEELINEHEDRLSQAEGVYRDHVQDCGNQQEIAEWQALLERMRFQHRKLTVELEAARRLAAGVGAIIRMRSEQQSD